ncbi:hypothetical protein HZS_6650 [Henneguya salminicola]|nr:hypothetical protein HZS_6650 [Henneguya salminicola]
MDEDILESSYHFNYLISVDWLIQQYPKNRKSTPIYLISGENTPPHFESNKYSNVQVILVDLSF